VVTEERDEEYEVEYVVDSRLKRGKLEYLVHWKGYGDEDRTWEPEANLENCRDLVQDYHKRKPSAPRKLRGISAELFSSMFKAAPEPLTDPIPIWSRLEVEP
jgi:Chromo (CHRromatin Organisation MOdifier) domain